MANKVLSIAVQVKDQASSHLRGVGGAMLDMGRKATAVASNVVKAAASFKALVTAAAGILALRQAFNVLANAVNRLDEFGEKARSLGIAVDDLSVMEYAAKRANVELEELVGAFKKGSINLADFAQKGKGPAGDALKTLGVQATDAAGRVRNLYEIIPEIGKALDDRKLGQAERLNLLADIFGKQGAAVERLIASGNLAEYRKELQALGGIITPEQVAIAAKVSDALDRVAIAWRGVMNQLVAAVGPNLAKILDGLAYKLAEMPDRIKGIGWAISEALSRGPRAKEAEDALLGIVRRAMSAMATTLMELGKLMVNVLIDAFTAAFLIVAPKIGEIMQDMLGSIAGWAGAEKSTRGKIKDLEEELAVLRRTNTERGKQVDIEKQLRSLYATRRVEDQTAKDMKDQGLRDLWLNTGKNMLMARAEIGAAWGTFDQEIDNLVDLYREANPQTTSAPGGDPTPAAREFGITMAEAMVGIGQGVEWAKKKLEEWAKKHAEIMAKNKAMADEMQQLQARALEARGDSDAADRLRLIIRHEEERDAMIRKYGASTQVLIDRLREVQQLEMQRYDADVAARIAAENAPQPGPKTRAAKWEPSTLGEGLSEGFRQATESVSDFGRIGTEVAYNMTTSFSSGLTQAIFDFVSGTESAGKAFGKFALQFLASTAQMIVQMLILRAVMGALGGGTAPATANTGGLVTGTGIRKYAGGGFVNGPNVNRDMVPAMLTPGEYVVSRRGVRNNDPATLRYMNMGGQVTPAGGGAAAAGGGVVVNQHVQLQGSGSPSPNTLAQLKQATMQGVLEALKTSPSFKSTLRGALA